MQQLINLPQRPQSAVDADVTRDIKIAWQPANIMIERMWEILSFIDLGDLETNVLHAAAGSIPEDVPHCFMPHPQQLLAAKDKRFSPREYSTESQKIINQYGDGTSDYLDQRLSGGEAKHDQTNLNGWKRRLVDQPKGVVNLYEVGFGPITRFETAGQVYNLPARDARKPLVQHRMIPGGFMEWAICMGLFKDLATEIARVDPYIVHPGTKVRCDVGVWSSVSRCWGWDGHAECFGLWDDGDVAPRDAMFALFPGVPRNS